MPIAAIADPMRYTKLMMSTFQFHVPIVTVPCGIELDDRSFWELVVMSCARSMFVCPSATRRPIHSVAASATPCATPPVSPARTFSTYQR